MVSMGKRMSGQMFIMGVDASGRDRFSAGSPVTQLVRLCGRQR